MFNELGGGEEGEISGLQGGRVVTRKEEPGKMRHHQLSTVTKGGFEAMA